MLRLYDRVITEVRRDNNPPAPKIPPTVPLGGVGGKFFAQKPIINRFFTINNTDYSDRVLRWPEIRARWDDAQPRNLTMKLANIGGSNLHGVFNQFFSNRPLLNSSCSIDIGYKNNASVNVSSGSEIEYPLGGLLDNEISISFFTSITSGHQDGQHKAFYRSPYTNNGLGYIDLAKQADGDLYLAYDPQDASAIELVINASDYEFLPGKFHHVAAVVGGAELTLYVDGIMVGSMANGWQVEPLGNVTEAYGRTGGDGSQGDFRIADLRIFNQEINVGHVNFHNVGRGDEIIADLAAYFAFALDKENATGGFPANYIGDITYALGPENGQVTKKRVFRGRINGMTYDDGAVSINLIDAFHPLQETQIGAQNSPIFYNNVLPSDIAFGAIVTHGGLPFNFNVDSESFYKWAHVFSANQIKMSARFDGIRPAQVLKELSDLTKSAIYVDHDDNVTNIKFDLFTTLSEANVLLDEQVTLESKAHLNTDDVINYQHVYADYDTSSRFHKTKVLWRDTVSAFNYGIHEDQKDSEDMWLVGSTSALYFAQRSIAMHSNPAASFDITTGLVGIYANINDTVFVSDSLLDPAGGNVSGGYRVLGRTINLDDGTVNIEATEAGDIFGGNPGDPGGGDPGDPGGGPGGDPGGDPDEGDPGGLNKFRLDFSTLDGNDLLL